MKHFFLVVGLLLFAVQAFAEVAISVSQGYRRDTLKWSISGPKGHPNILSELDYKHMDVYMTDLRAKLSYNDYFIDLKGAYGNIYDGSMRDSDYLRDDRKDEFSRSKGDITGDYTVDATFRFGRNFLIGDTVHIAPMVGYGYYEQKIRVQNGRQSFAFDIFTGEKVSRHKKIHHLNSTYKAEWQSPQLGLLVDKKVSSAVDVFLQYFFLYPLKYKAHGHWNLREDSMRHFTHKDKESKSFGHIATVGAKYALSSRWHLLGEFEYMRFYAKDGHVYVHGHKVTPFRKADRNASEIRLSLGYSF